jgi:hypothetical protein
MPTGSPSNMASGRLAGTEAPKVTDRVTWCDPTQEHRVPVRTLDCEFPREIS